MKKYKLDYSAPVLHMAIEKISGAVVIDMKTWKSEEVINAPVSSPNTKSHSKKSPASAGNGYLKPKKHDFF